MIGINTFLSESVHTAIVADVWLLHVKKNVSFKDIMEDRNMVQ